MSETQEFESLLKESSFPTTPLTCHFTDEVIEVDGIKVMKRKYENGSKRYRVIDKAFHGKWHTKTWEAIDAFLRYQKMIHLKQIGVFK